MSETDPTLGPPFGKFDAPSRVFLACMPGCLALVQFRRGQRSRGQKRLADKMDESSVAFTFLAHTGNIISSLRSSATSTQLVQQITRKEIRTAFTLVAFMCGDPALQPRMPQLVSTAHF